jgi:hypothetical protein
MRAHWMRAKAAVAFYSFNGEVTSLTLSGTAKPNSKTWVRCCQAARPLGKAQHASWAICFAMLMAGFALMLSGGLREVQP